MTKKVLVIGFGNPAREDDGLGPAMAEYLEGLDLPGITVDSNYQLSIEDAAEVAEHDLAVFIDAAVEGEEPFSFQKLEPKEELSFSSHSVEPASVMALAGSLFGGDKEGYMLGIRGYSFEMFTEGLTDKARRNLNEAKEFLVGFLTGKIDDTIENNN